MSFSFLQVAGLVSESSSQVLLLTMAKIEVGAVNMVSFRDFLRLFCVLYFPA